MTFSFAAIAALSACAKDRSEPQAADTTSTAAVVSTVDSPKERVTDVTGGGPVIQALPGPDAMADSAEPVDGAAPTHVMLTSQTRHKGNGSDFAYTCWDCTKFPVEQLHLMLMPPMGKMYQVPGGIIHVMWQKSQGTTRVSQ